MHVPAGRGHDRKLSAQVHTDPRRTRGENGARKGHRVAITDRLCGFFRKNATARDLSLTNREAFGESFPEASDLGLGSRDENDPVGVLEAALVAAEEAEPIERKIRAARKSGSFAAGALRHDVEIAAALGVITKAEAQLVERARALRRKAIMVDDFPKDLRKTEIYQTTQPVVHG